MNRTTRLITLGTLASLACLSVTSLAIAFSDGTSFASWYKSAVERMYTRGIVTGFADGKFHPERSVNRAELTVMLDRTMTYNETLIENVLRAQANVATTTSPESRVMVTLAEAGIKKLGAAPSLAGFTEVTSVDLPDGYTLYSQSTLQVGSAGSKSYLHLNGWHTRPGAQALPPVDEWYGPFYGYLGE